MIIGFIWDSNYPWDIRVHKICTSLILAGHEVHMVCRNTKLEKKEEIYQGIHIHRLPYLAPLLKAINSIMSFPAFFNPIWIKRIDEVVRKHRIQALIVRDITLSPPCAWIGKIRRIPVLLDMAEPYPEMIRAMWKYERMKPWDVLVRNPLVVAQVEKYTLRHVDHIFVVVEESKDRLINLQVPENKITIVSNTPEIDHFGHHEPAYPGSLAALKNNFKMIYIGYLTGSRGLQIAIQGMPLILKKNPKVRLIIVGSGKTEKDLRRLTKKNRVEDEVIFEGYVENRLLPAYVSSCEVGLIPHYRCALWNHTIPNKLFDYMAAAKPVLSSNTRPIGRIVKETGCGVIYPTDDPEQFSDRVLEMSLSAKLLKEQGLSGMRAVETKYNWSVDFERMLKVLESRS